MKLFLTVSKILFLIVAPFISKGQIVMGDSISTNVSYNRIDTFINCLNHPYQTLDYFLDIDNDNINDVKFSSTYEFTPQSNRNYFQLYNLNSVEFPFTRTNSPNPFSLWVDTIPPGTTLDTNFNWLDTTSSFTIKATYSDFSSAGFNYGFYDLKNRFLGFRKQNIYGWILIQINLQAPKIGLYIKSFAVTNGLQNSIKEIPFDNYITLYPNPSNTMVNLQFSGKLNEKKVTIKNSLGQTSQTIIFKSNDSSIDVSNLTNGIYFIEAETEKGIFGKKFIVNH